MKLTIQDLHLLESALLLAAPFYSSANGANGEIDKLLKKIKQMQREKSNDTNR